MFNGTDVLVYERKFADLLCCGQYLWDLEAATVLCIINSAALRVEFHKYCVKYDSLAQGAPSPCMRFFYHCSTMGQSIS